MSRPSAPLCWCLASAFPPQTLTLHLLTHITLQDPSKAPLQPYRERHWPRALAAHQFTPTDRQKKLAPGRAISICTISSLQPGKSSHSSTRSAESSHCCCDSNGSKRKEGVGRPSEMEKAGNLGRPMGSEALVF